MFKTFKRYFQNMFKNFKRYFQNMFKRFKRYFRNAKIKIDMIPTSPQGKRVGETGFERVEGDSLLAM